MALLVGLEVEEIKELLLPDQPLYRARQLYRALYHDRRSDLDAVTTFPADLRRELAANHAVGWPEVERRFESVDGTRRYLLRLHDGKTVEAVYMPETARGTICISTQAGCAVGCQFCLTALLGLERNLTAGEIVGQVLLVARDNELAVEGERLNIVMMGQGEPLLNLPAVIKATRILVDSEGAGLSRAALLSRPPASSRKSRSSAASPYAPSWRSR